MRVLITGATGLVGHHLIRKLKSQDGFEINILSRNKINLSRSDGVKEYFWDIDNGYIDKAAFSGVQVVINLAGENIFDGWWTNSRKKRIYNSRVNGTSLIVNYLEANQEKAIKLISASAIGIYGDQGDRVITEDSVTGDGFLARLCHDWENEALVYPNTQILRIGVVLAKEGGALRQLLPWYKYHLGAMIGSGKQYFSFIHIEDLIEIVLFLIKRPSDHSVYNATSPYPITNSEFSKALAKRLDRSVLGSIPQTLLKILLGEKSQVVLQSQRVIPHHLLSYGFQFKYPDLISCLDNLIV